MVARQYPGWGYNPVPDNTGNRYVLCTQCYSWGCSAYMKDDCIQFQPDDEVAV